MKLLTHNMLSSKCIKGVVQGYPLAIKAKGVEVSEVDFDEEFVARVIPKLDWNALHSAAVDLGYGKDLPSELTEGYNKNKDFFKKVHHILLEVDVVEGELICPESGRRFPINSGVPNMLLNEDEV